MWQACSWPGPALLAGDDAFLGRRDARYVAVLPALPVNNRVRELRADQNWSQQELGLRVGVSRQAINAVETGRFDPSLPLAMKLARVFNTTVEAIFTLDSEGD